MFRFATVLAIFILTAHAFGGDSVPTYWKLIAGSAFVENRSYPVLQRLCDEAGGRLVGSPLNERAQQILIEELKKSGMTAKKEFFEIPGWVRGNDEVVMINPTKRVIKSVALGYVNATPTFEAQLIHGFSGQKEILDSINVKDKIVLISPDRPKKGEKPLRSQVIRFAAENGAKAVLFINNRGGGLCLAGTASFQGVPAAVPAFSVTKEEGLWLRRLLQKDKDVTLRIAVRSYCTPVKTSNIVVRIPGEVKEKIVLGAHFDSWDLGQGSIDNGIGTAILFDVARLISQYHPQNHFTLEFVWFNGEELGLWGSKKYMERHKDDPIVAMINMDMTGRPTGFNAMGFDGFLPFLEKLTQMLSGFQLDRGATSRPWTNSDHMPFLMNGIPVFSLSAHLDKEQSSYYHSMGDTFDKVRADYLSQAAAVVAILASELANKPALPFRRLTIEQTMKLLEKFNLDKILKKENEWSFE